MEGEQVVPGGAVTATRRAPRIALRPKKVESKQQRKDRSVPALSTSQPSAKRTKVDSGAAVPSTSAIQVAHCSPAAEYKGRIRWATPSRVGAWVERWESARELGLHVSVRSRECSDVGSVVRTAIAEAVVLNVGGLLPLATVQKWLCLLFEYLELNADEQVLVVCLLRKYVAAGGKFLGQGDWARPQRWECVVAISCYFAVLLTEEFPGRTSLDLRELLGPNFRFGKEQLAFLLTVDWRISVDDTAFGQVKDCCIAVAKGVDGEKARLMDMFKSPAVVLQVPSPVPQVPQVPSPVPQPTLSTSPVSGAPVVVKAPFYAAPTTGLKRKRTDTVVAPSDDSIVPGAYAMWNPYGNVYGGAY